MPQQNIFQCVKQAVTTKQAAFFYGLKVNKNGMCCCPFHADRNPSMKVDERFHCFGCGADGDVINFTALLFHLSQGEAARKLASDFQIPVPAIRKPGRKHSVKHRNGPAHPVQSRIIGNQMVLKKRESMLDQQLDRLYRVYCDYLHLLEKWRVEYAPVSPDDAIHPGFTEAIQNIPKTEYCLDCFLYGSDNDRADLLIDKSKEVIKLEKRIQEYRT